MILYIQSQNFPVVIRYPRTSASAPVLGPRHQFPLVSSAFPLFLFDETTTGQYINWRYAARQHSNSRHRINTDKKVSCKCKIKYSCCSSMIRAQSIRGLQNFCCFYNRINYSTFTAHFERTDYLRELTGPRIDRPPICSRSIPAKTGSENIKPYNTCISAVLLYYTCKLTSDFVLMMTNMSTRDLDRTLL